MKVKIVSFHGLYSQGDNLEIVTLKLMEELHKRGHDVIAKQHDYPKLNVAMGYFNWSRDIVRDYMFKCLQLERAKDPYHYTIVLTHSNATWGISRVVGKYFNTGNWSEPIRIDRLVLFGSTVKRNYDWGRYPIDVINFVGTKDKVVWFSKLFRMGWSGRKGFKIKSSKLTQIFRPWRHSDFVLPRNFDIIKSMVLKGVLNEPSK